MSSKVYYTDMTTDSRRNILDKTKQLAGRASLFDSIRKDDLVAIKMHFGELGNIAFIPPPIIRVVVEMVKEKEANLF